MMLLTKANKQKLRKNAIATFKAGDKNIGHKPVVKFFNPTGAATWLFSELMEDGDTLFGLCDMGFGEPELGYASLAEIKSVRGNFGLGIERDRHFSADKTLTEYADDARQAGRIVA